MSRSIYTPELADRILGEVRLRRGVREICRDEGMPSADTVFEWVKRDHEGFGTRYREARLAAHGKAGPVAWSPELVEAVIGELMAGRHLVDICRDPGMPSLTAVNSWIATDRDGFAARYRAARDFGQARKAQVAYSPEMIGRVADGLMHGRDLRDVCAEPDMPSASAVYQWLRQDRDGFRALYRQAREIGCAAIADDIFRIVDDRSNDWIVYEREDGSVARLLDPDRVKRAELRARMRCWFLSRVMPRPIGQPGDGDAEDRYEAELAEMRKLISSGEGGLPGEDAPRDEDTHPMRHEMKQITGQCSDQLWRLNNLYQITDKRGRRVTFHMNSAQAQLYRDMHTQNVILKARQRGFTTFIQLLMLDACLFKEDVRAATIAHTLPNAQIIFRDKVRFPYDHLPDMIRHMVPARADNACELLFANNSSIRVGVSLRSGTLQYLHVSEYGKICAQFPHKAREVRSGALNTLDSRGMVFIESTAEGQDGHFFELCQSARSRKNAGAPLTPMDFKFHFSPWHEDEAYALHAGPVQIPASYRDYFARLQAQAISLTGAQQAWYVKKAEQQQVDMKREFPSTPDEAFEAAIEGAYYAEALARMEMDGRLARLPVAPGIPVMTTWDLGLNDACAIWWVQAVGREIRFIDYYENSGFGLKHYVHELNRRRDAGGFTYGTHYFPHDVATREISNGRSRFDTLLGLGVNPTAVPRVANVNDGINAVRRMLAQSLIDPVSCDRGLKALRHYRKEWDEDRATFRDKPLHNWASHGADALRHFAEGFVEAEMVRPRARYRTRPGDGGSWESA